MKVSGRGMGQQRQVQRHGRCRGSTCRVAGAEAWAVQRHVQAWLVCRSSGSIDGSRARILSSIVAALQNDHESSQHVTSGRVAVCALVASISMLLHEWNWQRA
jgi:hypothetical protein